MNYPIAVTGPLNKAMLRSLQAPLYDAEDFGVKNGLEYFKAPGGFLVREYKDGVMIREEEITGEKYAAYLGE